MTNIEVILKRFEHPDEVQTMKRGRYDVVRLGGMIIGRATFEPGWRWSEHVGRDLGHEHCGVEHVGMVIAGTATAAFADGRIIEMRAGELFYIPPVPHDSWVVGNEQYVSLHLMGFAMTDPFVTNGLMNITRIRSWNTVIGDGKQIFKT